MSFQAVLSNLKMYIFTTPTTFHGTAIGYPDLKIVDDTNITISLVGNVAVNKIMGTFTVNKDDDFPMLNIANELEGLGTREASEGMEWNQLFNFWWVNRLNSSIGKVYLFNRGNYNFLLSNIL
jgi:hypothetical protein